MEDDYYEILNVGKDASDSEIKKSYYKLAREFHPDKAPDDKKDEYTKKFQKIGEAYEVLSDKEKREIYDSMGKDGLKNGGMPNNMDPFDIFNSMFGGGGNPFGGSGFGFNFGNQQNKQQKRKNKESVYHLNVSLKDVYKGITKKLKNTKNIIINKETGQKVETKDLESTFKKCGGCGGQGFTMEVRQMGPMITQTQKHCNSCQGTGCNLLEKYSLSQVTEIIEINIAKGAQNSQQYRFAEQGNYDVGVYPGDIIIVLQVEGSQNGFTRSGNDLIYVQNILLSDALCGSSFKINTLDDRVLFITCDDVIKPGARKVIPKEGIANGNLVIEFNVVFPDALSNTRKKELLRNLPASENKVSKSNGDIEYKL